MPADLSFDNKVECPKVSKAAERSNAIRPTTYIFDLAKIHLFCSMLIAIATERPGRNPNWDSGRNPISLNRESNASRTAISKILLTAVRMAIGL